MTAFTEALKEYTRERVPLALIRKGLILPFRAVFLQRVYSQDRRSYYLFFNYLFFNYLAQNQSSRHGPPSVTG